MIAPPKHFSLHHFVVDPEVLSSNATFFSPLRWGNSGAEHMYLFNTIINQPQTAFWWVTAGAGVILALILVRRMKSDIEVYPYIRSQDLLETMGIAFGVCGLVLSILALVLKYYVGLIPGVGSIIAAIALIVTLFKNMDKEEELQNSVRLAHKEQREADLAATAEDNEPLVIEPGISSFRHPPLIDTSSSPAASGYRAKRISSGTRVLADPGDDALMHEVKKRAQH